MRELQKDFDLSVSYVLMWLLNKTTDSIIAIQLELKRYIEEDKKNKTPLFYVKGEDGEKIPYTASNIYPPNKFLFTYQYLARNSIYKFRPTGIYSST